MKTSWRYSRHCWQLRQGRRVVAMIDEDLSGEFIVQYRTFDDRVMRINRRFVTVDEAKAAAEVREAWSSSEVVPARTGGLTEVGAQRELIAYLFTP